MEQTARSIGQILWQARQDRGVSLEVAAEAVKIRTTMLDALEHGEFEQLPGGTYITGYLRAYGRYLALDVDTLVESWKQADGAVAPEPTYYVPQTMQDEGIPRYVIVTLSLLAFAAIYAMAAYWLSSAPVSEEQVRAIPEHLKSYEQSSRDVSEEYFIAPRSDDTGHDTANLSAPAPEQPAAAPVAPAEGTASATKSWKKRNAARREEWAAAPIPEGGTVVHITVPAPEAPAAAPEPTPEPVAQ